MFLFSILYLFKVLQVLIVKFPVAAPGAVWDDQAGGQGVEEAGQRGEAARHQQGRGHPAPAPAQLPRPRPGQGQQPHRPAQPGHAHHGGQGGETQHQPHSSQQGQPGQICQQ